MNDERNQQLDEAERKGDIKQEEAEARYQRAREGSLEGERSALLSLEMQTLQNRFARLERRVADLEDEKAGMKRERLSEST